MYKKMFLLLCLMLEIGMAYSSGWTYGRKEHGVDHWGEEYEECSHQRQSPIDFNSEEMIPKDEVALRFLNYNQIPNDVKILNNGHTVKLEFNVSQPLYMYGGGLWTAYKLAQIHLHWGHDDSSGSEHTVNGKTYPVEIHFVHFKARFTDLTAALADPEPDTLAVLGVFGELSKDDNMKLAPMINSLEQVKNKVGTNLKIKPFPASNFFPKDLSRFYRYEGSLTTPACNEIVMWTVAQKAIPISESQLDALRSLREEHGDALVDNYRPVQPINGRKILNVSTYNIESVSGASQVYSSVLITCALSLAFNKLF